MSKIILDDKEYLFQIEKGDSLFDLLIAAQDLWGQDREIQNLFIDDALVQPLTEDHLKSVSADNLVVKVELSEARTQPTLQSVLPQAIQYLTNVPVHLEGLAEAIRNADDLPETFKVFQETLDGYRTILNLVKVIREDQSCPDELKNKIDSLSSEIIEILKEMNEAQEQEDRSTLGDLVEYELPEITEGIRDILQNFHEKL